MFESELPSGFRRATIEGAWLFALALPLACQRTGAAPEPEPPTGAYRHEASATTAPSVHHFMPRFDEIDLVELIGSPDSERHLLDPVDEWSFDREAHALEIGVPVPEGRRVAVWATRAVPWRWNSAQPIVPGSVRVLLGKRAGVRGEDFETDEAAGEIEFLSVELCDPEAPYFVVYRLPRDPEHPELTSNVTLGNHRDQAVILRFLGLPAGSYRPALVGAVGQRARATGDASVFWLARPLSAADLHVGIAKLASPTDVAWLEAGDYAYDEGAATITLRAGLTFDATEYMFASGPLARIDVLSLGRKIDSEVDVLLGERLLVEGVGYTVDREMGQVTLLDPEFLEPRARYFVSTGELAFGNTILTPRMKELLKE